MTARKRAKEEVSQADAAHHLGMTPQSLGKWARKPGAPVVFRSGRRLCIWPDFPVWVEAEKERSRTRPPVDMELAESEKVAAQAKAEIVAMKASQMRGELVPAALHQERLNRFVGGLLAVVDGRLHRFERDIVQAATPAEARKVVDAIKQAIKQGGLGYADELESEADEAA